MEADNQSPVEASGQQIESNSLASSLPNPSIPRKRSQSPRVPGETTSDSAGRSSPKRQRKNAWRGQTQSIKKFGKQTSKKSQERGIAKGGAKNSRDSDDRRNESNDGPKPIYAVEFSKEEIAEEERRPKKKVAVLIGYCGTGYKGLQIMPGVKTVESDIFGALVAAKAVSKANANEPKKVQLVRCARTDKGVHAGGNVLSLKMIIEDKDIVQKINEHLPPQIRIWGIEQTLNSFSAYQQCDSRIYEYLIPTHCFLPPHPQTFLAKKLEELAEEVNDVNNYHLRQEDTSDFWTETEKRYVKPILDAMDPEMRTQALKNLFADFESGEVGNTSDPGESVNMAANDVGLVDNGNPVEKATKAEDDTSNDSAMATTESADPSTGSSRTVSPLEQAIRSIKHAHHQARLAYRISPARLARIKAILAGYVGTWRYHNYTVSKRITDPSAKRHIKSFVIYGDPFLIGDTEWISLKVHGQSFMMNQIRKMVLMVSMMVRCGTPEDRIQDSFNVPKMSIPRAPALGLLLERPIFEAYNKFGRHKGNIDRAPIEFDKYQAEIDAFKQKEIYERMWKDEAEHMVFENFYAGLDSLHSSQLLWASSKGLAAIEEKLDGDVNVDVDKVLGGEETIEPGGEEG